jgi:hypothetical protein
VHLPIWPVAALLGAAVAAAIGMSVLGGGTKGVVTSVTDSERLANSSAAIREAGATLPAVPAVRPIDPAVIEGSAAAVREMGATLPFDGVNPGMWTQAQAEAYVDSLTVTTTAYVSGLENPGAYLGGGSTSAPKVGAHRTIEVNGEICGQCR